MNSRTITAVILAYLVPGGGHFYLGRRGRALAFFVVVLSLFLIGLSIDGRLYTLEDRSLLNVLATFGSLGAGLPYFIAQMNGPFGDPRSITFEHGTAFTLTAGLMNLLLVLDAFDIAQGRKS